MEDDWRNEQHRWKDLKRVEIGRRDIHEQKVFAKAYFKQTYDWQWVPCFVHGDRSLQWQDYFEGRTLTIPGGILYPRTDRKAGEDNLIDAISKATGIDAALEELVEETDSTKKEARASLLLNGFDCPAYEASKRMGIADPRRVRELADRFETLFVNTDDFHCVECDRGDIVDLEKHC